MVTRARLRTKGGEAIDETNRQGPFMPNYRFEGDASVVRDCGDGNWVLSGALCPDQPRLDGVPGGGN